MFDMMKMMGKIKEAQEKIQEAQKNLVKIETTAEAGAGMVKATANGKKQPDQARRRGYAKRFDHCRCKQGY